MNFECDICHKKCSLPSLGYGNDDRLYAICASCLLGLDISRCGRCNHWTKRPLDSQLWCEACRQGIYEVDENYIQGECPVCSVGLPHAPIDDDGESRVFECSNCGTLTMETYIVTGVTYKRD